MARIKILEESQILEFNSPPKIESEELDIYFFSDDIKDMVFIKPVNKIGYILQRGYFLYCQKFFTPQQFNSQHITFVKKLFAVSKIDINDYNRSLYIKHRNLILQDYGFIEFSDFTETFENEAFELVKTTLRPRELFNSLISFLIEQRVEIPRYYVFAEIISKAFSQFELRLINQVESLLSEDQKIILDELLNHTVVDETIGLKKIYLLTKYKKPNQELSVRKIKESLIDFKEISMLHKSLSHILKDVGLSNELINFYAVWVIKMEHYQIIRIKDKGLKRLYLIAFILYQYRLRQDLFVDLFLKSVRSYLNTIEKLVTDALFANKPGTRSSINNVKDAIKRISEKMNEIGMVISNSKLDKSHKYDLITNIYHQFEDFSDDEILTELDNINIAIEMLKRNLKYSFYDKIFHKINNKAGGIIEVLDINKEKSSDYIYDAIQYFLINKGKIKNDAPVEFIDENELRWIYNEESQINPRIFKSILFKEIADNIKSGQLNLNHSNHYRAPDDYLIDYTEWLSNSENIIKRAKLEHLTNIDECIENWEKELDSQYIKTNESLKDNEYLKFTTEGKPVVKTPKIENDNDITLQDLLKMDNYVSMKDILSIVGYLTDIESSFHHYGNKTSKQPPNLATLYAAIMALGCNIGVRKMGRISNGLPPGNIEYTQRWYLSKENLDDANRKIIAMSGKLPIYNFFKSEKNGTHTASDGQKFNISVPTIIASQSFKYFGAGAGFSVYSFIDEQNRLFYGTVISATDREASYVLDGLLHNEEISSTMHSTDTHGYREMIFGICNALGIFFAPRIKDYNKQVLYTFKSSPRKKYEEMNFKILPNTSKYIQVETLRQNWDLVLRTLCTIKLKYNKASDIIKRLNSYSRQHPLYKALNELGRIYKTLFLLKYLDDVMLRQAIEKQLNVVERSHQFAKAVFFGQNQEFSQDTKEEQEVAVACRHLLQNSISFWNGLNLSKEILQMSPEKKEEFINALRNTSLMSWQHVNFLGEYDFKDVSGENDFDIETLTKLDL